jgi:hypothetical protein
MIETKMSLSHTIAQFDDMMQEQPIPKDHNEHHQHTEKNSLPPKDNNKTLSKDAILKTALRENLLKRKKTPKNNT